MYGGKGGGSIAAIIPTTAGIAVLPNTGGNPVLLVASLVSIVVGGAILLSTAVRVIAKHANKA